MSRKLLFLFFLIPVFGYAEGPKYRHKEAPIQLEFENAYQDIRSVHVSTDIAAGSTNYIQNNGSGSNQSFSVYEGTFTHAPVIPNANASNQTVAYGQIQYLQNAVQATITASTQSTASSFVGSGLKATITPTSGSSRIKVTVTTTLQTSNGALYFAYASIRRGSTDIAAGTGGFCFVAVQTTALAAEVPCSMSYIDSPATTSATTYEVTMKIDAGGTVKVCGNAGKCSIIVEELR